MSDPEGRRIYIARNALRKSVANYGGAYAVSYALAATRATRIVGHNIEDPFSPASQMMRPHVAAKVVGHLVAARQGCLDDLLLKRIGFVPNRPKRKEAVLPALGPNEATFATCYDSENNWYTVATGAEAADRMWRDDEPAASLLDRLSVRAESLPDDLQDLTVITENDDLFPVSCNSDGEYVRSEVSDFSAGKGDRRGARVIDVQTRKSYLRHLGDVGLNVYHDLLAAGDTLTGDEMLVIGDTFAACRNSLEEYASY